MGTALLALCFCAMSLVLAFAICDKQAHNKGIRTKTSINTKSVQLIELHAFACYLLCIFFSALTSPPQIYPLLIINY